MFGGIFQLVASLFRSRFVGKHADLTKDTLPDSTTAAASCVIITRDELDLAISIWTDQAFQFVWADDDSSAATAFTGDSYRIKGSGDQEIHCRTETNAKLYIRSNGAAGTISHSRLRN